MNIYQTLEEYLLHSKDTEHTPQYKAHSRIILYEKHKHINTKNI